MTFPLAGRRERIPRRQIASIAFDGTRRVPGEDYNGNFSHRTSYRRRIRVVGEDRIWQQVSAAWKGPPSFQLSRTLAGLGATGHMVKILFATNHSYLPQRAGGSESSTHDLCVALGRRSISTAVLAALEPRGLVGLKNRLKRRLRKHTHFPVDQVMGYPVFRGWNPREGVDEVIDKFNPDVAIIQAGRPMILAYEFLNARIPCIVYFRDTEFHQLGGPVMNGIPGLRFAANSNYTATKYEREFGVRPTVIPPLINPERYRAKTKGRSVLFINPRELKGVEIAFRLAEHRQDIPFEFVESWKLSDRDWNELKKRAKILGNIKLWRYVPDMRRFYRNAKIVLVPSVLNEAWGRVVTEAQISAIPVLASYRAGLPESVGPGGILVDPDGNFSEWERALSRLWDDPIEFEKFSHAALDYSRRPEIQPEYLTSRLLELISDHLNVASRFET